MGFPARHLLDSELNPMHTLWMGTLAALLAAEPQYSAELIFPLHDAHNHAPGIAELADGELLVSWYRGSGERTADDVAVYGSRLRPTASRWSTPFLMADTPGFPDCNTALMADDSGGGVWVCWPVMLANSWEACITRYKYAADPSGTGSPKWTREGIILLKPDDFEEQASAVLDGFLATLPAPLTDRQEQAVDEIRARLGEKLYQRLGWQPRCKPTVLPSGRILLPLYSDTYSVSIMAVSDDDGQSWYASGPLLGFGNIQPSVLRRKDGTLVAYMRENGILGRIRVSKSIDDGLTWGPVGTIGLPNPGSGLDGLVLESGRWLLVYNDTEDGRNQLAVSLSDDEGRTWPHTRYLEEHELLCGRGQEHEACGVQ